MHSVRGRLTIGITLLLGGVLLVAGVLVARDVERSERQVLDDRLVRTAELSRATAVSAVEQALPGVDRRLEAVLSATDSSLRLSVGGAVLLETGRPPPGRPVRSGLGLSTIRAGGRNFRVYSEVLRDADLGGLARIEVTSGLTRLEDRQFNLRRRLLVFGVALLLLAAAGVWLAVGRVLRPLRRLREATSGIAGDADLGRRVPADDGPAELRSLAASFNAMLMRLNRSAADRNRALAATRRFAADAGHELRTPLTSVQATLSTLARHPGLDAADRTEMADGALAEQRRLVDLLDGLQALARGDTVPADMDDIDIADVVDDAVGRARGRHPAATFVATLPAGAVLVHGWEPGLRLLVDNLLENAAHHGRAAGTVHVHLRAGSDGRGATFEVEDDGPGIAEADRGRVFEPFARLHGDDGSSGSGLGLALVAQQARHHGADVAVDDGQLGGARFTVTFATPAAARP